MGQFFEMVVKRNNYGPCTKDEIQTVCSAASENGIGCIIVPNKLVKCVKFDGTVLDYDEFYFAVENTPYLFNKGLLCVFESDVNTNTTIYKHLISLEALEYRIILFCNENDVFAPNGKPLKDALDGYAITLDRF